jgi:hypothetical protein
MSHVCHKHRFGDLWWRVYFDNVIITQVVYNFERDCSIGVLYFPIE